MTTQDPIDRLQEDLHDPDEATIEAAFASVERRVRRRRSVRRSIASATLLVFLGAGIWAGVVARDEGAPVSVAAESGSVAQSGTRTAEADPREPVDWPICGATPSPASEIGLIVEAPAIEDRSIPGPVERPTVPVTFTNDSDTTVGLGTAEVAFDVLDDSGATVTNAHGTFAIGGGPDLEPGESVTIPVLLPRNRCDVVGAPVLEPGTYDVAVTFTASTGEGPFPNLLRSTVTTVTYG